MSAMRWPLLGLAALVTLWIEFVPPAFAQVTPTATLPAGTTAYGKGEFNQAYELLQPLAEAGEPEAEWYLGLMHVRGEGASLDNANVMQSMTNDIVPGYSGFSMHDRYRQAREE